MNSAPHLLLNLNQVWIVLIGGLVPLVSYVLNKVLPVSAEHLKAAIQVLVAAAAGALYTAVNTNVFGANAPTLQLVITAVAAALASHNWLWKPAGVNVLLGAVERGV